MAVCTRAPGALGPTLGSPKAHQSQNKEGTPLRSHDKFQHGLFRGNPRERNRLVSFHSRLLNFKVRCTRPLWWPICPPQFWDPRAEPRPLEDRRWERMERLGTSFQEDDGSISQTLIKLSKVTICGPQPAQRPSCSDNVRQVVHQSGAGPTLSHHSLTGRCWNAQSLVLFGGAGGRNKDGCESSPEGRLGECTMLRGRKAGDGGWRGRGVVFQAEDHRGSTEASCHDEKAIRHGKLQMSLITFHTSSLRGEKTKPASQRKGQKYHHPSAFQDGGEAAKVQREESSDKDLTFQQQNSGYWKRHKSPQWAQKHWG